MLPIPKGYDAARPDLVVTRIKAIKLNEKWTEATLGPIVEQSQQWVQGKRYYELTIRMRADDREKFGVLMEKAVNKLLIVMLGETRLGVFFVLEPVRKGDVVVYRSGVDEDVSAAKRLQEAVAKLAR